MLNEIRHIYKTLHYQRQRAEIVKRCRAKFWSGLGERLVGFRIVKSKYGERAVLFSQGSSYYIVIVFVKSNFKRA